jgi:hypothetical protein
VQRLESGLAHSKQNFLLDVSSVLHLEQRLLPCSWVSVEVVEAVFLVATGFSL